MLKVKDNFLNKKDFKIIQNMFMSEDIPWSLGLGKTVNKKTYHKNDYQLTHTFFMEGRINSSLYHQLEPILNKLKAKYFIRIKANLVPSTDKIFKFDKHVDQDFGCKAAIFYLNTNNGLTVFKNKKINAKENRMVFFNANEKHQATTCTDKKFKMLINFNYQ